MMLLSACTTMVGSADAICELTTPTFTEKELVQLSNETIAGLDLYAAQIAAACSI